MINSLPEGAISSLTCMQNHSKKGINLHLPNLRTKLWSIDALAIFHHPSQLPDQSPMQNIINNEKELDA